MKSPVAATKTGGLPPQLLGTADMSKGAQKKKLSVNALGLQPRRPTHHLALANAEKKKKMSILVPDIEQVDEPRQPNPEALARFRKLGRMIKTNLRWAKAMKDKQDEDKPDAFVVSGEGQETLVFDKSFFRADRKSYGGLTLKIKTLLSKLPCDRTSEDLFILQDVVNRLTCFDKYPRKVKHELARIIQFDCFEDGRVIIAQGHMGLSFYFIVKGGVNVQITEKDKRTGKHHLVFLTELKEGASFGELALLHNIRRSATIICKGISEFLRVDKEDFEDVLLASHEKEFEEKMKAMEWIPLFSTWPEMTKIHTSNMSKLEEFAPDMVIYGNTNEVEPDNVYFIISGECRLVKEMRIVREVSEYGRVTFHLEKDPKLTKRRSLRLRRNANEETRVFKPETHFWTIGVVGKGFYFSLGEDMTRTFLISKTRTECIVVPRVHFIKYGNARMLDKLKEDVNQVLPSEREIFRRYFEELSWDRFKHGIVSDVCSRKKFSQNTKLSDIPKAIYSDSQRLLGMTHSNFALFRIPKLRDTEEKYPDW